MATYMIHVYPKRLWYVEDFMIPAMLKQGIKKKDIIVYNDTAGDGNLYACVKSFASVPDDDGGIWHLQDDILLASNFKEQSELHDEEIVYGFSGRYDNDAHNEWLPPGRVHPAMMWSSFQCVRVPNKIARAFSQWYYTYMEHNPVYADKVKLGKFDDWFFKMYCKSELKNDWVLNLAPNIVDHVDQVVGGSIINGARDFPEYRSRYWEEPELYDQLVKDIAKYYKTTKESTSDI